MYLDRLQCSRESSVAGGSEGRSGRLSVARSQREILKGLWFAVGTLAFL